MGAFGVWNLGEVSSILTLQTIFLLPGSSAVEQSAVNREVVGSIPTRAAIYKFRSTRRTIRCNLNLSMRASLYGGNMSYGLEAVNDVYIEQLMNDPNIKISDDGCITTCISMQGHITDVWRKKEIGLNRKKYHHVSLHRVMYRFYYGSLSPDMVINHKDGDPGNNTKDNLELVPQSSNNLHAFRDLKRKSVAGHVKYTQSDIEEVRRMRSEGAKYSEITKRFGMTKGGISDIINGKTWSKETTKYTTKS
jgi:hypothetical protein